MEKLRCAILAAAFFCVGAIKRRNWLIRFALSSALLLALTTPRVSAQYVDDHNPIGVSGTFEGVIQTGCGYNVLNHSTSRTIDDIVVPGSIGKYPLKMTRYYVSRGFATTLGPEWRHEYTWIYRPDKGKVEYPNGNVWESHCNSPVGVSDYLVGGAPPTFRLADGGTVVFGVAFGNLYLPSQIIDPYGQTTTLIYNGGLLLQVTEPGGRYLLFTYNGPQAGLLSKVEAYDGQGHRTDSVNYTYARQDSGGNNQPYCLITATYSDNTTATYTYEADNVPDNQLRGSFKFLPLLSTANDVRYHGPMRRIAYVYQNNGPHGAITAEKYSAADGNKGVAVSSIGPDLPGPLSGGQSFDMPRDFTETRGDGNVSRSFHYTRLKLTRTSEPDGCPFIDFGVSGPQSQVVLNYTDFQGHTTALGYDANWYVNSVTDANNHTTSYQRGPAPVGEILRITHPAPDSSYIQYGYQDHRYLTSIIDERGNQTVHTRDANHRITHTDYKDANNNILAYETFTYNSFGQALTHRLKNGAYESFAYDSRGLLTDKWNPKQDAVPSGTDPHTHYTYYTSGPWTDRILTMTLPANVSGYVAAETYEYDRNSSGVAVAGRGLVTKITHGDNTYQAFGYDAFGNKLWEENELRQRTSYTYDAYNRVLTITNPLNQTVTNTYTPTNGTGTSPYLHTTNNPDTVTTPTNIRTTNDYDQNFRKTSTTVASSTTRFGYDAVGNPTTVTDPLNHTTTTAYDSRNRKRTVTNALNQTTTSNYDAASNVASIVRPDNTTETKTYDALNRVLTDTVPQTGTINLTTWFVYNPSGTIYKIIDPNGQPTWFTYNASDEKIGMIYSGQTQSQAWTYDAAHNLASRTTVGGETQSFTYDNRNRKVTMRWSNNADWANFGYDAASRLTSATSPNSIVTRAYDAAGRLSLDRQNISGLGIKDVNYIYDADGKQTRLYVTGAGYDYTFAYDGMGRFSTISATGNANPYFQYYYDAASNETQRYNLYSGVNQIYTRDALNRMSRRDVKKGTTTLSYEAYTYDAMSRLRTVTREDNKQDQFNYYWDGELSTAQYGATPAPTPTPTPTSTPAPTPAPPTATAATNVTSNGFTANWGSVSGATGYRLDVSTSSTFASYVTGYQNLDVGNVNSRAVSGLATSTTYYYRVRAYNGNGTSGNSNVISVTTSAAGQVATPTFRPDGTYYSACAYSYTFNVIISTTTSGAQISYTSDGSTPTPNHGTVIANGGIASFFVQTGQTKTLKAIGFKTGMTNSNIKSANYSFDRECGQGPEAVETVRTVTYNLDKAGNRTLVGDTVNGNATYTPNALNQYTAVTGSTISNGPEHEISAYQNVSYTYINDEHLTRASDGTNTYDLTYDALGRCVKRILNGVTTYYIYDGEKPILEYNANNALVGFNLYGKGIDEIIERGAYGADNAWHWYFYQQDRNGNVTHLTNYGTTVTAIEKYRYDAFGKPTIYNGSGQVIAATAFGNRFLFTGREYAATFGFYEYRARAYNPALGRFMSEDPKLFDAGDYNLFRYCHNDPIDMTDPMGLEDHREPWFNHQEQAKALDRLAAARELLGLSSTYIRAALSAQEGVAMAYATQTQREYSYSLKPRYNIGNLSGARGQYYVWDPNDKCSGQCLTGVQHLTGAPSSKTPLHAGDPVGVTTRQGTAIATGLESRNGQLVYPSRGRETYGSGQLVNHAAIFVGRIDSRYMQILSQWAGKPLHFDTVPMAGWNVITSRLPPSTTSTSELRAWGF
jgi:RHS repeat-associated protein